MKVIVHDLQEKSWQELGMKLQEKDIVIGGDSDGIGRDIGGLMGDCSQLVLISRCVYGGFSPFVQGVLEKYRKHFGPFLEMAPVRAACRAPGNRPRAPRASRARCPRPRYGPLPPTRPPPRTHRRAIRDLR